MSDCTLSEDILSYLRESESEVFSLIESMCHIPAPSGMEDKRAVFCKKWLSERGASGVYIDDAKNVVYPIGCEDSSDIVVFLAHTDTVFSDTEPLPYSEDDEYIYSPGVGDDTASVAVMLNVAAYIAKYGLNPRCGVLIVANSSEEGLGNLKGIRQIMKDYEGRISAVYSFDASYTYVVNKCVGSHRYRIDVMTEGGHSFGAFGKRNAIHAAAELISRLYSIDVPIIENSKTTYNVGVIEGGTSVNTIAQSASFLYEYRSDNADCIETMKARFNYVVDDFSRDGEVKLRISSVGERPCESGVDPTDLRVMTERVKKICKTHSGLDVVEQSGSTDSNIPMSQGIPSVTIGVFLGDFSHTREERVLKRSIPIGMRIAAELMLGYFE